MSVGCAGFSYSARPMLFLDLTVTLAPPHRRSYDRTMPRAPRGVTATLLFWPRKNPDIAQLNMIVVSVLATILHMTPLNRPSQIRNVSRSLDIGIYYL